MENIEKELTYKGYNIKIIQDETGYDPNEEGNEDVFLVYDHRSFEVNRKGFKPREIFEHINATKKMMFEGYHVFTVYAYIHSGVSLSLGQTGYPFNDRWDVSSTGFMLVKKVKGWSYRRDAADKIAEMQITEWNMCLSGQVYGYIVEKDGEEKDAMFGFVSEKDGYVLEEAKSVVDYYVKEDLKSHLMRLKIWILNKVPLMNRKQLNLSI